MTSSTRYPQSLVHEFAPYPFPGERAQTAAQTNAEISRLLTAAVVNRRFCRLLLHNPLAALAGGYRGEAFHLDAVELKRISAIRATSLRDFALQLVVTREVERDLEAAYSQERQGTAIFVV
jgi:hypothetical protein